MTPTRTRRSSIANAIVRDFGVLVLALVAHHALAVVPDEACELRFAEQVVPQLVVGDAVWLATPRRAKVLALYATPVAGTDHYFERSATALARRIAPFLARVFAGGCN